MDYDRRYEPAADRMVHYQEFIIPLTDAADQGRRPACGRSRTPARVSARR